MIVVWADTALEHLAGIKQYISQTSPLYAELVVRRRNAPAYVATAVTNNFAVKAALFRGSGGFPELFSGATVGAKTTALTFNYRYTSGAIKAADADVLTIEATSAALQLATATMADRLLSIEIDASAMTAGHSWLTLEIGAEADAGEMTILAHLLPRYPSAAGVTCLV